MASIDDILRFGVNLITTGSPSGAVIQQSRQSDARSKLKKKKEEEKPSTSNITPITPELVNKPDLSEFDPLVNQVKFAQSIAPFVESMLQQATSGMAGSVSGITNAANQYQSNIQSLPDNIRNLLSPSTDNLVSATKNLGQGLAASGSATLPYQLLMSAIQAMQAQEKAYREMELGLQKEILLERWKAQQTQGADNDIGAILAEALRR